MTVRKIVEIDPERQTLWVTYEWLGLRVTKVTELAGPNAGRRAWTRINIGRAEFVLRRLDAHWREEPRRG